MRKHSMMLTVIAAVLLVALCIDALELSHRLLPDYQDSIEEISLSEYQSILTVNSREAVSLYPWDIYESVKNNSKLKPVQSSEYEFIYPDKQISQLISIFSPWVSNGYESIEWNKKMEYLHGDKDLLFFIKDVTFTDNLGISYLVNIALTDERLLYYACDRLNIETIPSEIITSSYDKLNKDYSVFRDMYRNGIYTTGSGESESDGDNPNIATRNGDANCFELFIQKLQTLEYAEIEWMGSDPALVDMQSKYSNLATSMIGESGISGTVYKHSDKTPNVVNVDFSIDNMELVLFYDLEMWSITGFSMKI